MNHNFQICKTRMSNNPAKELWHCENCDTIVETNKGQKDYDVNKLMTEKMPCLPPIIKPLDEVIDNRTHNLNQAIILDSKGRRAN